jgi:hypothetical protein
MRDEEDIGRKLDAIASILKIAFSEEIEKVRATIRSEPGKAAILDGSSDWTAGGPLVKAAAKEAKKTERSIQIYRSAFSLIVLRSVDDHPAPGSSAHTNTGRPRASDSLVCGAQRSPRTGSCAAAAANSGCQHDHP